MTKEGSVLGRLQWLH